MNAALPGRVPETAVAWPHAARLVPARYRPADCFERLDQDPGVQELQAVLADFTASGVGDLAAMDPSRVLFGPGAGWINAPFLAPRPGRFSTTRQGAFYAARELETSVAEVKYHLELSYRSEGIQEAQELEYRALRVHLDGTFHDIRGKARAKAPWAGIYDPVNYAASQSLAGRLRGAGSRGILWLSLRRSDGECCAVFDPATLRACRHDTYLTFRWNGREVTQVYERRILALKA